MLRVTKSIIDGLGASLPDRRVTTAEVLAGCRNPIRLPLERLTGIRARRLAGGGLYSIDLAERALRRCLETSGVAPQDYDLLICTNISRRDAEGLNTFEPAPAVTLKRLLGFDRALALDLSNACAGMWTGVFLADALIRTGEARHALVVSGEYISYLIETAQLEIADFMDPQIASLTLGDAGVAVSLGLSPSPEVGLHDLDIYTISKYSPYCIAKPSNRSHGGAVMYTDAIKVTEAVVPLLARHAKQVVDRNGWALDQIDHIIPHQTSRLTMLEAQKEIQRLYRYDFGDRFVNNLAERGNTSSNSHFLAVADAIAEGRINSGDNVMFCISGSGQTTGAALYTCDDLPCRLRAGRPTRGPEHRNGAAAASTLPVQMELLGVALERPANGSAAETLPLLERAAAESLRSAGCSASEVDLALSVGTYRSEFIMEPAIAALAAGRLNMNDDQQPDAQDRTFAFDLMNGPVGFLKACYLVGELARAGAIETALLLASEVENNRDVAADQLLGLEQMASAVLLREDPTEERGFLAFAFEDHLDHLDAERVNAGWNADGRAFLLVHRAEDLEQRFAKCVQRSVQRFLQEQDIPPERVDLWLPPQVSCGFVRAVSEAVGFSAEKTVAVTRGRGNLATSSVPAAVREAIDSGRARPGSLALVATVGAGVQVGCALYRF